MDQERVTERVGADGRVTERTVERTPGTAGTGGGFLWMIVALIAVGIVAYFLIGMNNSESRKDAAIAGAASEVGDAAKKIGDGAEDVAKKLTD